MDSLKGIEGLLTFLNHPLRKPCYDSGGSLPSPEDVKLTQEFNRLYREAVEEAREMKDKIDNLNRKLNEGEFHVQ